jgi:hypothetical protein
MVTYKLDRFLQWQIKKSVLSAVGLLAITIVLAIGTSTTAAPLSATTGMSNCTEDPTNEDCNPQPDRVGNDNDPSQDADRDGPGGDDTDETDNDEGDANCWGQVSKGLAQKNDGKPGLGEHSSDPVGDDEDNETPREGVGNQREGHPSDHADTVGGLVDDRDTDENETPDCVD